MSRYMKKRTQNARGQSVTLRRCYVYEIRVDGVVRYIGKGCKDRIYQHLIEAKRTASRPGVKIRNLGPHFRKMLVSAVRRGLNITETIISSKLTDAEAYKMEWQMIWDYHKNHAGQLWNTIDERGRNPEDLPEKWSNPVYPLYRLPRPLNKQPNRSIAPIEGKTANKRKERVAPERTAIRMPPDMHHYRRHALEGGKSDDAPAPKVQDKRQRRERALRAGHINEQPMTKRRRLPIRCTT
jgi:hypothetical protein